MGDMIKAVIGNFDLKSGVSSRLSFCPIFNCFGINSSISLNCFGENSSIFKALMENGKF